MMYFLISAAKDDDFLLGQPRCARFHQQRARSADPVGGEGGWPDGRSAGRHLWAPARGLARGRERAARGQQRHPHAPSATRRRPLHQPRSVPRRGEQSDLRPAARPCDPKPKRGVCTEPVPVDQGGQVQGSGAAQQRGFGSSHRRGAILRPARHHLPICGGRRRRAQEQPIQVAAAGGGQLRFGLQEHELHPPCVRRLQEGRAGRYDLDYLLRRRRQHPARLRHGRRRVSLPRPEPPPDRRSSSIGGREGEAAALASAHVVAPPVRNGLLLRCHPLWLITAVCMQPTQPNQLQTPTLWIVFVFALFDAT